MKKIAFIIRLFQKSGFHGGGEKLFYQLITRLIKDNFVVDIYCSRSDITKFPGVNNIKIIDLSYDHLDPASMEAFYDRVKQLTASQGYSFIISENITPPVDVTFLQGHSLVYRKNKLKNFFESFLYNFRSVKKRRIKYQQKWMSEGYRKIFVPSNILKRDIMENFNIPEDKISVIYPGVDIPQNLTGKFEEQNKNCFTFGLSAPGFKIKGGYVLIEALLFLKKHRSDFKVKIIYPKAEKNLWLKLLTQIYNLEDNIEFLPLQKDMNNFYNSIDCLLIPSIEDTFGLVALEAMAHGKICIISSNAGASEIIQDSYNGFIVKSGKNFSRNLFDKMLFILNNVDKVSKIRQSAFELAGLYSWDKDL